MERRQYSGVAERGQGRGSELGYPTANIVLGDPALRGIYAATVTLRGRKYCAAVYANQDRNLLEAHLLDFWGELYGQELTVELRKKLRDGEQFEDEKLLKAAIGKDVQMVREYFEAAHTPQ